MTYIRRIFPSGRAHPNHHCHEHEEGSARSFLQKTLLAVFIAFFLTVAAGMAENQQPHPSVPLMPKGFGDVRLGMDRKTFRKLRPSITAFTMGNGEPSMYFERIKGHGFIEDVGYGFEHNVSSDTLSGIIFTGTYFCDSDKDVLRGFLAGCLKKFGRAYKQAVREEDRYRLDSVKKIDVPVLIWDYNDVKVLVSYGAVTKRGSADKGCAFSIQLFTTQEFGKHQQGPWVKYRDAKGKEALFKELEHVKDPKLTIFE